MIITGSFDTKRKIMDLTYTHSYIQCRYTVYGSRVFDRLRAVIGDSRLVVVDILFTVMGIDSEDYCCFHLR